MLENILAHVVEPHAGVDLVRPDAASGGVTHVHRSGAGRRNAKPCCATASDAYESAQNCAPGHARTIQLKTLLLRCHRSTLCSAGHQLFEHKSEDTQISISPMQLVGSCDLQVSMEQMTCLCVYQP